MVRRRPDSGLPGSPPDGDGGGEELDDDGRLAWYDRKIAVDPGNAALVTSRGVLLNGMGRIDEAMADFNRALELDPTDIRAIVGRAECYLLLDRDDEALAVLDVALELDPADFGA